MIAFLKDRIEDPVALPKRIGTVDAMPLTPVGKIFKPTLRAEAIRWAIASAGEKLGLTLRSRWATSWTPASPSPPRGWTICAPRLKGCRSVSRSPAHERSDL